MANSSLTCRFCNEALVHTFVDLGQTPLANSYLDDLSGASCEKSYPLHARVCSECFLVQVEDVVPAEDIFSDYAYFSSYSESWVQHAKNYADRMQHRFALTGDNLVMEVASNDGYLLQHFVDKNIPVLGIEPAANVAKVALEKGINTEVAFFGIKTARKLKQAGMSADLIAANNVLAHVPDINDFVSGFTEILSKDGVVTIEFPHLLNLIHNCQFDTIYHEHYSYLSLLTVEKILSANGLKVFDVEELPTHGGSLRVFACLNSCQRHQETTGLALVRGKEAQANMANLRTYSNFESRVKETRAALIEFLETARKSGKSVAAYGAAAKGNTLLNYCSLGTKEINYVVDKNPEKQNKYLPGSHLPIYPPSRIFETKPDYVLILPWNLADEIAAEMKTIREWGGQFVVPVPTTTILK